MKAKLKLIHPFKASNWHLGEKGIHKLYWLLKGRGIQKRFKILELFKAIKERNRYNNQITKCFCPRCDNELCGSNSYINLYNDLNRLEYFKCSKCGEESKWDFDCIAPLLIKEIK